MQDYKTVFKETSKEMIEKKSRFIAHIKPIENEKEALDFISKIKTEYWDATHNVYAYSLKNENIQRYSDDGEPQGTAGIPTLGAIKNLELNDVAVVVTRYFGGTLLGASGLVRAYGKSAKEGLIDAQIVVKQYCKKVKIDVDYSLHGRVQSEVLESGYIIENIIYKENVTMEILLNEHKFDEFKKVLSNIVNYEVDINVIGEKVILLDEQNKLLKVY